MKNVIRCLKRYWYLTLTKQTANYIFLAYDSGTTFIDLMSLRNIRCPQDLEFDLTERYRENFVARQFPIGSLSKEDQKYVLFQLRLAIIYAE